MKLFFEKFRPLRVLIAFLTSYSLFFPALALGQKQMLPLAKPYCFLLPKKNAFAHDCAHKSVQNIVSQYARGGVQVIPIFRWWGNDHSEDPSALEAQAIEACNLDNAYPWAKGKGSVQVFTSNDVIPSLMCGKDPVKDPAAGCSNLCPAGTPSFSTVSGTSCSAGVSIHESGHSNCCGSHCHNEGDQKCKPNPVDGGCGLCLKGGADSSFYLSAKIYLADNAKGGDSCQLTEAALASIRQGAAENPGYLYDPNQEYKIRGKQTDSIYNKKTGRIRKLEKGVGDPPAEGANNLAGNVPATDEDLKEANPRRKIPQQSGSRTPASGRGSEDTDGKNRKSYTQDQIEGMVD